MNIYKPALGWLNGLFFIYLRFLLYLYKLQDLATKHMLLRLASLIIIIYESPKRPFHCSKQANELHNVIRPRSSGVAQCCHPSHRSASFL